MRAGRFAGVGGVRLVCTGKGEGLGRRRARIEVFQLVRWFFGAEIFGGDISGC